MSGRRNRERRNRTERRAPTAVDRARDELFSAIRQCGVIGAPEEDQLAWMAEKVLGLRLFADREDKMNLSLGEAGGALLVVSQFTLYGDARKGRRPSFIDAARPETAIPLYERFVRLLRDAGARVETGEFGAMMDVELVNDGPVTLLLER